MSGIRERIENSFGRFARFAYRNRVKVLLVMMIITAAFVSQLPKVRIDTSTEGFLHENDPDLLSYYEFRDQFGRDEMVIVALKPKNVFDIGFLRTLKSLHDDLAANVPHIDDITSLVNVRNTRGEKDRLIVEDLLETFPANETDLARLRERVLAHPLYRNLIISEDGTFTTIVIKTNSLSSLGSGGDELAGFDDSAPAPSKRKYLTDVENGEIVRAVRRIAATYESSDLRIFIAGSPVVIEDLKLTMIKDMRMFMMMALLLIAVTLYLLFRRLSGVLLPLVIVILTVLSTLGMMGLAGAAIKLPTQILPSFLLAVSVGASVHVLAIFFHRFQTSGDQEESIVHALGHSGLAVVMTSITTAAGLASFATADIAPIADLGIFAAAGVLLSLVYTIVLPPAVFSLVRLKRMTRESDHARHARMDRILTAMARFASGNAKAILLATALITAGAVLAIFQLNFSHNPLLWLNKRMPVREAMATVDREMKGSVALEVIVDTKKENGLYEPVQLNRIDLLDAEVAAIDRGELFVGKTISITDIVKEINQALNENRKEYYAVPQDRALAAQEFLLFENSGSDDLEDVVDSRFSKTRFTVKLPWLDSVLYRGIIDETGRRFRTVFGPDADITVTGIVPLFGKTVHAAMDSAVTSYIIAAFVITLMMILFIGSLRMGLVSMAPNVIPIVLTMGIMGLFGFPLDMFTLLIGSIAIGLAVDDTIHFLHNFRRYYHETGDSREAVLRTFLTTGRAMIVTSIVLSFGFFIFILASMYNLMRFGILTGLTIVLALAADFFVTPALMMVLHKPKKW